MKLFLFLFWTISIIANNIYSQTNLINNPGFEKGKTGHLPRCNYGIEPGHNTSEAIETDILNWEIASCHVCDFAFGTPDWIDDTPQSCAGFAITTVRKLYKH